MNFKVGDYVTRKSYGNDIVFVIIDISSNIATLKGYDVRLIASSSIDDLVLCNDDERKDNFSESIFKSNILDVRDRDDFFYLPPKIMHLDGDNDYLKQCLKFYEHNKIMAFGKSIKEDELSNKIAGYLNEFKPDILVITGHDAYYKADNSYKNSNNFVKAVQEARKYEKSHDKLLIIAGACQSNYEELIKAGADFASSPKRVNIHALDPAIIATNISLTEKGREIDLINLLEKTKYGKDGMGGLMVNGMMYVGYPR